MQAVKLAEENDKTLELLGVQAVEMEKEYEGLTRSLQGFLGELRRNNLYFPLRVKEELQSLLTSQELIHHILPQPSFLHAIKLRSSLHPLFYRNKVFSYAIFSLSLKIVSESPVALPVCLKVEVFKVTSPPVSVLVQNSRCLLDGALETCIYDVHHISLPRLRFTDVTKQFPFGRVHVVIYALNRLDIRPLVLEGLRVKARNRGHLD